MKTVKYVVPAVLSAFLLPASAPIFAQATSIADCQAIQDRLARYACYDSWDSATGAVRQSAPAPRARAQQAEPAAPAAAPAQASTERASAPETAVADFGRQQSSARIIEGSDGASELIDRVAALEQLGPNMWVITLEGGQQWKQMLTKRYALQVGDEVRIYPTRWGGSYRLGAERLGGHIQVERIDSGADAVASTSPAPRQQPAAPPAPKQADEPSLLGRLFNRDGDEADAQPAPAAAATAVAGRVETSVENFGRPQADARLVDGEDGAELVDTIADLEQLGPNLWLISLEGGQRWQQMLSKRYALQEGDEIRIYPTRWGSSFRLSANRIGGYIQVERVD